MDTDSQGEIPTWLPDLSSERWWDGAGWTGLTRGVNERGFDGPKISGPRGDYAGWYPDKFAERWWNGTAWTTQVRSSWASDDAPVALPLKALPKRTVNTNSALLFVAGVLVIGSLLVGITQWSSQSDLDRAVTTSLAEAAEDPPTTTSLIPSTSTTGPRAPVPVAPIPTTALAPRPTTTTPTVTSTLAPALTNPVSLADHPYFRALRDWTAVSSVDMQRWAVPKQPAWSYARHLAHGFQAGASRQGIARLQTMGSDALELCLGASCSTLGRVVERNGLVESFAINGVPLDELARSWATGEVTACLTFGSAPNCGARSSTSIELVSMFRSGGSTYVGVSVLTGAGMPDSVSFGAALLDDRNGIRSQSNAVTSAVNAGSVMSWLLVFKDVHIPSAQSLYVDIIVAGATYTASLEWSP